VVSVLRWFCFSLKVARLSRAWGGGLPRDQNTPPDMHQDRKRRAPWAAYRRLRPCAFHYAAMSPRSSPDSPAGRDTMTAMVPVSHVDETHNGWRVAVTPKRISALKPYAVARHAVSPAAGGSGQRGGAVKATTVGRSCHGCRWR